MTWHARRSRAALPSRAQRRRLRRHRISNRLSYNEAKSTLPTNVSVPFVDFTGGGKPHVIMTDNMGERSREVLHSKWLADDKGVQRYREDPRNASALFVKNVELIAKIFTEFFRRRTKCKQRR